MNMVEFVINWCIMSGFLLYAINGRCTDIEGRLVGNPNRKFGYLKIPIRTLKWIQRGGKLWKGGKLEGNRSHVMISSFRVRSIGEFRLISMGLL